jgi:hypothetical protein
MSRTPSPSLSGRSTQAIALALAGLGTAVFLLFLFPRMTASRAAAPRVELPTAPAALVTPAEEPKPRPVELPNPMGLDAAPSTAPEKVAEIQASGDAPVALALVESPLAEEGQALLSNGKPPVVGPKLTYATRDGKNEKLAPGAVRQKNKQKAKERLEKATEKALAEGTPLPEDLRAKTAAQSNGEKPVRPNAKGKKKREPKPQEPKPQDG